MIVFSWLSVVTSSELIVRLYEDQSFYAANVSDQLSVLVDFIMESLRAYLLLSGKFFVVLPASCIIYKGFEKFLTSSECRFDFEILKLAICCELDL